MNMHGRLFFGIAAVALMLAGTGAQAQSRQVPAPQQKRPVAIVHATVHNPPTAIDGRDEIIWKDGYVLFEDGRITGAGSGDPGDLDGYDVLDAAGLHVYPGLIAGPTQLGLVETLQVEATDDRTELDNEHPEIAAWIAINPDSDLIPVTRSSGILTALVFPSGGTIGAQPSAIRLDGWTTEDLVIDKSLGVLVNWPLIHPVSSRWSRRSRGDQTNKSKEQVAAIDRFFDDAEAWVAARAVDPTVAFNARFAAMAPGFRVRNPSSSMPPEPVRSSLPWPGP
jgi:hypothetical protein